MATISQIKGMVAERKAGQPQERKFDYHQLFLPVATEGKPVMKVTARHDFINGNLKIWREFHINRAATVAAAIGVILLLPISVYASAASAIGAGWFYGEYLKKNFHINKMLKARYMLEST